MKKRFDAIEMSRRLRKNTGRTLAGMKHDQRVAALREARERFLARRAARTRTQKSQ